MAAAQSPHGQLPRILMLLGDGFLWGSALLGLAGLSIPPIQNVVGTALLVVAPLALILALRDVSRLVLLSVVGMVATGGLLAVTVGASMTETSEALTTMCGLFAFIAVVRLIELPLLRRHLDRVVAARLSHAKKSGSMLWPGALVTYALSLVLSFGAIPAAFRAVTQMFGPSSPASSGSVVSRTFISANSLTPMSPPIALALSVVGITWVAYAPIGLLVSAVGVSLLRVGPRPAGRMVPLPPVAGQGTVREFVLVVGSVLGLVLVLQLLLPGGGVIASTVVAVLLIVPAWELVTGGGRTFARRVVALATSERRSWRDQYALLIATALLVAAAVHWGQDTEVLSSLLASGVPPVAVLVAVPVLIVALSLVGVNPMTSLFLVCTVLPPLGSGSWDVLVVAVAVLGAHVGFLVSPLSGLTLLMSAMARTSPVRVGLQWNLPFGLAFLAAGIACLGTIAVITLP